MESQAHPQNLDRRIKDKHTENVRHELLVLQRHHLAALHVVLKEIAALRSDVATVSKAVALLGERLERKEDEVLDEVRRAEVKEDELMAELKQVESGEAAILREADRLEALVRSLDVSLGAIPAMPHDGEDGRAWTDAMEP
ncbi:hypothetical protein [Magnetospirillum sp. SS-4]|uniref:hypothetical protein n=1 Tax=Magnetospirillum sp. SS-4 TaxID=2681465 RepID=UPI001385E393|nr:hypothetical protein [Magnetospirillum sp. SS-4]CAA7619051.1 hypothetical protein MTBSS4_230043 [Magnetospirillum sp. SS-4]